MELSFTTSAGLKIYGSIESAQENTRGVIILIHGLGEHLGRYDDWATRFNREGFNVIRIDLPGHGKSEGKRGHIPDFDLIDEIIDKIVLKAKDEFPGMPVVLYGHSLGGTIVLNHLLAKQEGINLSVVTSPWIKLSFEPPRSKMILAGIVKNILPSLVQETGLVTEHLSHDTENVKKYIEDPMVHSKISVALFTGVHNAAGKILERGSEIDIQVLILHGRDDLITSPGGSRLLEQISPNVKLRVWDGGFHELHNEPFKDEVFTEIVTWLKNNL